MNRLRHFNSRASSDVQKKKEIAENAAREFVTIRDVLAPESINQRISQQMETIGDRIEELCGLCEDTDRDANELRDCLPELRDSQAGLFQIYREIIEARGNDGFRESNLFRLAGDVLFDDEVHRLQARELENRRQLQKWLTEVREQIPREEIMDWCGKLENAVEELEKEVDPSHSTEEKITKEIGEIAEIEALEHELEEIEEPLK
jgi:chromosome segregation ATPase